MTRIRFEDLPSTNTPRNAENLNKLNNVVISSTEPTTGEEVWIQKSKNIFDKNGSFDYGSNNTGRTFLLSDGTIKTTANWDEWAAAGNKVEGILPNTNYTLSGTLVSSTGTGFHNIALIIVKGYANGSWHNIKEIGMDKPKDFYETFNSGEYANIFVSFNTRGTIGKNYEAIFDNIQIEQGSIATSYEPYIDKKIYVKNDNGGYEEFYNEEPTKTEMTLNAALQTYYRKVGYFVEITLGHWETDVTVAAYKTYLIGTLPEGYRPRYSLQFPIYTKTSQNKVTTLMCLEILRTGEVNFKNPSDASVTFRSASGYTMFPIK